MLWILDYQRDIAADLRVFGHVSWREALEWSGPELLAFIHRLPAYGGVLAARVAEQHQPRRPGVVKIAGTREAFAAHPELAGSISFGTG